jgi:hypothetical protein
MTSRNGERLEHTFNQNSFVFFFFLAFVTWFSVQPNLLLSRRPLPQAADQ